MSFLQRTSSSSSSSSSSSTDTAISSASNTSASLMRALSVPYSRRRVTAEQLKALNNIFDTKSHPTRGDRIALANEMGMELKTVTNWFQNKRQTSKKKSLVWSGDFRPQSTRLASSIPHSARLLRPTISLDQIAGLHEKFTVSTINSDKPPLTPRNSNRRAFKSSSNHKNALWDHMPSSPIAPPSSPSADSARLSILPQRSKTKKSLEWACAKARAEGRGDDEGAVPDIPEVQRDEDRCEEMGSDQETDTDSELDEAITPDGSANFSPGFSISLDCKGDLKTSLGKENIDPNFFPRRHESEDMEAAIVLLGFMGPR